MITGSARGSGCDDAVTIARRQNYSSLTYLFGCNDAEGETKPSDELDASSTFVVADIRVPPRSPQIQYDPELVPAKASGAGVSAFLDTSSEDGDLPLPPAADSARQQPPEGDVAAEASSEQIGVEKEPSLAELYTCGGGMLARLINRVGATEVQPVEVRQSQSPRRNSTDISSRRANTTTDAPRVSARRSESREVSVTRRLRAKTMPPSGSLGNHDEKRRKAATSKNGSPCPRSVSPRRTSLSTYTASYNRRSFEFKPPLRATKPLDATSRHEVASPVRDAQAASAIRSAKRAVSRSPPPAHGRDVTGPEPGKKRVQAKPTPRTGTVALKAAAPRVISTRHPDKQKELSRVHVDVPEPGTECTGDTDKAEGRRPGLRIGVDAPASKKTSGPSGRPGRKSFGTTCPAATATSATAGRAVGTGGISPFSAVSAFCRCGHAMVPFSSSVPWICDGCERVFRAGDRCGGRLRCSAGCDFDLCCLRCAMDATARGPADDCGSGAPPGYRFLPEGERLLLLSGLCRRRQQLDGRRTGAAFRAGRSLEGRLHRLEATIEKLCRPRILVEC